MGWRRRALPAVRAAWLVIAAQAIVTAIAADVGRTNNGVERCSVPENLLFPLRRGKEHRVTAAYWKACGRGTLYIPSPADKKCPATSVLGDYVLRRCLDYIAVAYAGASLPGDIWSSSSKRDLKQVRSALQRSLHICLMVRPRDPVSMFERYPRLPDLQASVDPVTSNLPSQTPNPQLPTAGNSQYVGECLHHPNRTIP